MVEGNRCETWNSEKEDSNKFSHPRQLADLHIYIVPVDKWIPFRRLARNQVVEETVSAGFVRIPPNTTLFSLRSILREQLDLDIPEYYVFIRSVGRNFTQVKSHQEQILKVKHFLPPQAKEPELHVLEINQSLIKESGSVPNLLLSDTDMSDTQGIGSVLSGRISHVGLEEGTSVPASRFDSLLEMPQSYRERSRSVSNGEGKNAIKDTHMVTNTPHRRRHTVVMAGATDIDEENIHDFHLRKASFNRSQSYSSVGVNLRAPKHKKPSSRGVYSGANYNTYSSEGEDGIEDRFLRVPHRRSQTSVGRGQAPFYGLHRSASLNMLSRPFSQESLPEEGDINESRFRRSRRMDSSTHRGQRSLSVSAIERKRGVWHRADHRNFVSSDEMKRRSLQENRNLYAPHRWMLQRDARRKARIMEKELEEMREAKKAEEARKFEEQIKKEEDLLRKEGKLNKKERKTEILNLEEPNFTSTEDINFRKHSKGFRKTDLTYPPEGVEEGKIVGRRVGAKNESFQVTYEIEFSGEKLGEEKEEGEERMGRGRGGEMKGRMNKFRTERGGRRKGKGRGERMEKQTAGEQKEEGDEDGIRTGKDKGRGKGEGGKEHAVKGDIRSNELDEEFEEHGGETKEGETKIETNERIRLQRNEDGARKGKTRSEQEGKDREFKERRGGLERGKGKVKNVKCDRDDEETKNDGAHTRAFSKGAWAENKNKRKTHNFPEEEGISEGKKGADLQEGGTSSKSVLSTALNRKKTASYQKDRNISQEEIDEIRREKAQYEEKRTYLFSRARSLHEQILLIREKRRQQWWENYNQARRNGVRLEERQANLRQELEILYRKIIGSLMRSQPIVTGVKDEPSRKASYKISVIRLRHEISDLIRRVEAINIKLQAEMRLRQQAAKEVKQIRSEVSCKKANVALSQSKTPSLRNIAFIPEDILIRL